jgi:hypothetical protein
MSSKRKPRPNAALLKAIDAERGNLGRAISVLQCLEVALEHGEDFHSGPHYVEVAQVAISMIAKSVDALDEFNLPKGDK